MKKIYLLLTITFLTLSVSYGQLGCNGPPYEFTFDNGITPPFYWLRIDTVSNPNNIWQIGSPQKTVISSAHSAPNAIITDTVNSYPPNDTSVFIIGHTDQWGATNALAGYYNVNTDSLNDFGTIEVSVDQGTTWTNIITSSQVTWNGPKPTLTGNSNGWQYFETYQVYGANVGDTVLFRFTFISDSIADTLDGLAFDNIMFCDYIEGIGEIQDDNLISISPNPSTNELRIENAELKIKEIEIYNTVGEKVFSEQQTTNLKQQTVDVSQFPPGLYFVRIKTDSGTNVAKFVKE